MINYTRCDKTGFNVLSAFVTDGGNVKRAGRKVTWGATQKAWRKLRFDLENSPKAHKAVTKFMCKVGLNPDESTDRVMFSNGWSKTFPQDSVSGLRAINKRNRLRNARV